jgi:choline dehydrogenase-like flavoprotein
MNDVFTGNCSHQHGTARMRNDPYGSVTNRFCSAYEVDYLSVVDGSSFPTGTGTGTNPTLTIMASAWRVGGHIADARGRPAAV